MNDAERQVAFDRFMSEASDDLPVSLDGECWCGGIGTHRPRCPLEGGPMPHPGRSDSVEATFACGREVLP